MDIFGTESRLRISEILGFPWPEKDSADKGRLICGSYRFEGENHARSLVQLAEFVASYCLGKQKCLCSIGSLEIWPSQQDRFLINAVLEKVFGERASLFRYGSFFVYDGEEIEQASAILHLAMLFGWDISVFSGVDRTACVSHDGFVMLWAQCEWSELSEGFQRATDRELKEE
jgi:hypothetical protein